MARRGLVLVNTTSICLLLQAVVERVRAMAVAAAAVVY
jgi:hypothetical protein